MSLSFGKLVIILFIVVLLFGAGRIPRLMGDVGKGLRALRNGLKDDASDQTTLPTDRGPST
jgi:sec-independent protein translocase protein TatA